MHRPPLVRIALALLISLAAWTPPAAAQQADSTASAELPPVETDPQEAETLATDQAPAPDREDAQARSGSGDDPNSSQAPAVKSFALDADLTGAVANSVNLFTGDAALPIPLLSLPGRHGLDVSVSASYNSNVQHQVDRWNVEAPTGILGLGWSLGYDQIVVDHKLTGARADDEYYLLTGGQNLALVRTSSDASEPHTYEPKNYQFWKIEYWPSTETWVVTKEDGVAYEFGDSGSGRHTVQWGVRWGNWIGSSSVTSGQSQFAVAWNLSTVTSRWGDTVTYEYDPVMREVGSGGEEHTEASYLKKITDVYDRTVTFHYLDKCYDDDGFVTSGTACSTINDAREYQDPHTESDEPDAYQDRYESRFLDYVEVKSEGAVVLSTVHFAYDVAGSGDTAKRRLTSVMYKSASGEALPPLTFTYRSANPNKHALETVTSPQGGTATYTYAGGAAAGIAVERGIRDLTVSRPSSAYEDPRVWIAEDYVVVTWRSGGTVKCYAYTWDGEWIGANGGDPLLSVYVGGDVGGKQNFEVYTENDFFALVEGVHNDDQKKVYLYHKNNDVRGGWHTQSWIDESGSNGMLRTSEASIATGNRFLVIVSKNEGGGKRFTWDATASNWAEDDIPRSYPTSYDWTMFLVSGTSNYYMYHEMDSSPRGLTFSYLDEKGVWQSRNVSSQVNVGGYGAASFQTDFWYPSRSFAAVSVTVPQVGPEGGNQSVVQWGPDYDVSSFSRVSLETYDRRSRVFVTPSFVTFADDFDNEAKAWRFDGATWREEVLGAAGSGTSIAQGPDWLLNRAGDNPTWLIEFDPNRTAEPFFEVSQAHSSPRLLGAGRSFYLVYNNTEALKIGYRLHDGTWQESVTSTNPSESLLEARAGAEYFVYSHDATTLHVEHIRNGEVQATESFDNEGFRSGAYPGGQAPLLAGASTLVTHDGVTQLGYFLDAATELTLRRVVAGASDGPLADYPVTALALDDGYQTTTTGYAYNTASATYDPSGTVAQYNEVAVVPGVASPTLNPTDGTVSSKPYGFTRTLFFNGLSNDELEDRAEYPTGDGATNADDHLDLLRGTPYKTQTYAATSATNIAWSKNYWHVTARTLGTRGRGTYARLKKTESWEDGVKSTATTEYAAATGLATATETSVHDSYGNEDDIRTELTYWWEQYDTDRSEHLLTPVVQTTTKVNDSITRREVTTWKSWGGVPAPDRSFVLKGDAPSAFPDEAWTGGGPGSNWLKTSEVLTRNADGLPTQVEDAAGVTSSTLYGHLGLPVASFANAAVTTTARGADASFLDFESGAGDDGTRLPENDYWGLYGDPGENAFSTDAHTGRYSRNLKAGTSVWGPTRDFNPTDQNGTYVFSAWVKTPAGFGAGDGELWFTTRNTSSHAIYPSAGDGRISFGSTEGQWVYVESILDLQAIRDADQGDEGTLWFRAYVDNHSSTHDLLVDDIRFGPLDGSFAATVYDPDFRTPVAALGANGQVAFTEVDAFQRPVEVRDRRGRVVAESFTALSREVSSNGLFNPARPNASTSKSFPYANPVANGSFELSKTANGTPEAWWAPPADAAVSLYEDGYTGARSMRVHANTSNAYARNLLYDPAFLKKNTTYSYSFWARCEGGSSCSTDIWLVRRTASGQYLASASKQVTVNGSTWRRYSGTLTTGSDVEWDAAEHLAMVRLDVNAAGRTVYFDDVLLHEGTSLALPSVAATYTDGAGKPRQSQALDAGGVTVTETLYDAIGRTVAQTRPALIGLADLGYRPAFVSDGPDGSFGTRSTTSTLGAMAGEVEGAYNDDYPYSQSLYEPSPRARVVEQSTPGSGYQIGSGRTTHVTYRSNTSEWDTFVDGFLPDNQYVQREVTDPDGITTMTLTDKAGRLVAQLGAEVPGLLRRSHALTANGNTTTVRWQLSPDVDQPVSWSLSFTDGGGGTLKIGTYYNGSNVLSRSSAGSGSFNANASATYYVTLTVSAASATMGLEAAGPDDPDPDPDPAAHADIGYAEEGMLRPMTKYYYDQAGHLRTIRTPNFFRPPPGQDGADYDITMTYDGLGRMITRQAPDEGTTRYVYDAAGRLRFAQNGEDWDAGRITYTKYDRVGRPVETGYVPHDAHFLTFQSDLRDEADDATWPEADEVAGVVWRERWTYDYVPGETGNQGRLVKLESNADTSPAAEAWETYAYDADGNLERVALSVPEFDASEHAVRYAYNDRGDVTRVVAGDTETSENVVTYAYDRLGRVAAIGDGAEAGHYAGYGYNPEGAIIRRGVPGNLFSVLRSYNAQGRLSQIDMLRIGGAPFREDLAYTDGGLVTSATFYYGGSASSLDHTYTFAYDDSGQLTTADHSTDPDGDLGVGSPIAYDPNGNITRMRRGSSTMEYAYYDGKNRVLHTDGAGTDYGYDGRGNVTSAAPRGITEIAYDPVLNLPTKLVKGSVTTEYRYLGPRRVLKRGASSSAPKTLYVHGASDYPLYEVTASSGVLSELRSAARGPSPDAGTDGDGFAGGTASGTSGGTGGRTVVTTTYYAYGPDGLVATRVKGQSGSLRYIVADHLGSTRVVLDASGSLVSAFSYDAWGQRLEVPAAAVPYQYTGQEYDAEAGLMNYRARLYDPAIGRFYATDPAGQFASPYLYAANNPVMMVDPDGEFVLESMAIFATVNVIVNGAKGNIDSGFDFAFYAVTGAMQGGLAAGTGGVSSATGALVAAGSSHLPSVNVAGVGISPAFAYGSGGFSLGLDISASVSVGGFNIGGSLGGSYTSGGPSNSLFGFDTGFEGRASYGFSVGSSDGGHFSYYRTTFTNPGQTVGSISGGYKDFTARFDNDANFFGGILGDGGDRFRTAALTLSYGHVQAGLSLYTGDPGLREEDRERRPYPGSPAGEYVSGTARAPGYRMGAAFLGFRTGNHIYRAGMQGEPIRHFTQNQVIHRYVTRSAFFRPLNSDIRAFTQFRTYSPFTQY